MAADLTNSTEISVRLSSSSDSLRKSSGKTEPKEQQIGPPEITSNEIEFDEKKDFIGKGGFGVVYRGRCRGKMVAVKIPTKTDLTDDELASFRAEVALMRSIYFPHVVLFLGACTDASNLRIVTELMEMDLGGLIHHPKNEWQVKYTLKKRVQLAKQIAQAMSWLHTMSVVHRDLKPANILVDHHGTLKISDFGFAALKSSKMLKDTAGPIGTAKYMSPEVMKGDPFDEKSDIYAFALILWEMVSGDELYPEYDDLNEFLDAVIFGNLRPQLPDSSKGGEKSSLLSVPSLISLIQACWAEDPVERPTASSIVDMMDDVIVDCSITHGYPENQWVNEARQFWKKYFLKPELRDTIPWNEFCEALSKETNLPVKQFQSLFRFISSGSSGAVTIEKFSFCLLWFGPFFVPSKAREQTDLVEKLSSQKWFYEDISQTEAEQKLRPFIRRPDTFLIRLSRAKPECPYSISKVSAGDIPFQHKRITHLPNGKLEIPAKNVGLMQFDNLFQLVNDKSLRLTYPCVKSEYIDPYRLTSDD